jgi:methylglutaconyl-CoA hydratase
MKNLALEVKDGVLWCRLNRPQVRNAFNPEMISELADLPKSISTDVRAVVLIGEGAVFSAGGDLNWMKKSLDLNREQNFEDAKKLAEMYYTLDRLPVPLVGLIHGAAMGGGVGLVSVCDYAIATTETVFSFSEVRLGIIPACISPFILRKIGIGHTRALFTTAEKFGAQKALEIGLIHQIAANHDELLQLGEKKLSEVKECGPNAIRLSKNLIFDVSRVSDDAEQLKLVAEVLANVRVSPEGQEGLRAFLEKRKPDWGIKN